uniref:RNA helicase n=1 Tax=Varanus komodoensis TaxID=61221 RepID=A0A8D2Q3D1_VARKO
MIQVFILKIENPDCFWVCIKGGGKFVDNEMDYQKLQSEMNQFYNKSFRCMDEIKPSALEEGQACTVYCQELKSWCRAVVKSIISCTDYYVADCFLVDYAKSLPVKTDRICVALESFMRLPYRAKKFRLYCTKPVTLRVDYCSDSAEIVPANCWDISAIQYFQNLLNATTQVEAKLCAIENDLFDVYLYVTIKGEKVCVNDDLVAKNFAYYEMNNKMCSTAEDQKKTTANLEPPSKEINPALVFWPMLLQPKEASSFETCKYGKCISEGQGQTGGKQQHMGGVRLHLKIKCRKYFHWIGSVYCLAHLPVVLSNKIEPCSSLETAPLFLALKKELLRNHFLGPSHVQSYSWPAIARGCDSVIICPENDPLLYLLPIITFLQSRSCYISLPVRNGPIALIVCPGQKKAELVFELLETYIRCSRPLYPMLLLLGMNKEEIKSVRIPRGCEIMVTTPQSLLRLLECHSLLFLRLCHLVFDEVDVLFSEASEQIFNILEYYKKNLNVGEKESAPQQIVAVGSQWTKNAEYLTKEFMNDPYIVITAMEEGAIYGKVQQVVQLCLEHNKMSTLLQTLDFTPTDTQKTLIFTSSVEETEIVYKAVMSSSIFCLKMSPEIGFHSDYVIEQWNKCSGTYIVLVVTDDSLPALGITDATGVIHFSFPSSPRIFGARLYSMSANFQNPVEKTRSILLLTEKSACHAVGVLRYLKRTGANIPPELCDFTSGVLEAKEDCKRGRPLCHYLKAYGICKNKERCPDRHRVSLQTDLPRKLTDETLPTAGTVTILPLFVVDATHYFGRIVAKQEDQYTALAKEMNQYYKETRNCVSVDTVENLKMYALHKESSFHRVQVLEVERKEDSVFCIHIKYIDEGRTANVQNYHLLNLPEEFQDLPPQAVEFIVCRVKPIDNEVEWNPKVTRFINHKIKGEVHEAKIVLALGNTVWVDPVVRITKLQNLKTSINEYNIRSEILSTGLGVDNPGHIQELQSLFKDAEIAQEPDLWIDSIMEATALRLEQLSGNTMD